MKQHKNKIIFLFSVLALNASIISCTKNVIEDGPIENQTEELTFDAKDSVGVNAELFLNNIYSSLPSGFNRVGGQLLDAGSDDALPSSITDNVQLYSNGGFNELNLPDNVWDANYRAIRKVNLFLSKIDIVPLREVGLKARWKAEARGMRALFYFELIKLWGGVPLLGDKVLATSDNLNIARNTFDECAAYIVAETNAIEADLYSPKVASATSVFFGRFTKGAAMALKAKTLLYAASPLWNASNDVSKWQLAADAAKTIIDSVAALNFPYALSTGTATAHYSTTTLAGITTAPNLTAYVGNVNKFLNVFSTRAQNEYILAYMTAPDVNLETINEPVGFLRLGQGRTNPTQELVNDFEMYNGKLITETGSGYSTTRPYYNRDPRLVGSVFFDSLYWINRKIQLHDGGLDRPLGFGGTNSGETRTGYYMRKFLTSGSSASSYSTASHLFPIFRYAEVLLNYAEALNEVSGPIAAVYSTINTVRTRVGMPALPAGLSQVDMRNRIQHERRVEFAFEEQRFFDIRRWKIAGNTLNGKLHGIQGVLNAGIVSYNEVDVAPTRFDITKMYLYPIPQKEMTANPNMVNNPNW